MLLASATGCQDVQNFKVDAFFNDGLRADAGPQGSAPWSVPDFRSDGGKAGNEVLSPLMHSLTNPDFRPELRRSGTFWHSGREGYVEISYELLFDMTDLYEEGMITHPLGGLAGPADKHGNTVVRDPVTRTEIFALDESEAEIFANGPSRVGIQVCRDGPIRDDDYSPPGGLDDDCEMLQPGEDFCTNTKWDQRVAALRCKLDPRSDLGLDLGHRPDSSFSLQLISAATGEPLDQVVDGMITDSHPLQTHLKGVSGTRTIVRPLRYASTVRVDQMGPGELAPSGRGFPGMSVREIGSVSWALSAETYSLLWRTKYKARRIPRTRPVPWAIVAACAKADRKGSFEEFSATVSNGGPMTLTTLLAPAFAGSGSLVAAGPPRRRHADVVPAAEGGQSGVSDLDVNAATRLGDWDGDGH
jgi:hypothetical protein